MNYRIIPLKEWLTIDFPEVGNTIPWGDTDYDIAQVLLERNHGFEAHIYDPQTLDHYCPAIEVTNKDGNPVVDIVDVNWTSAELDGPEDQILIVANLKDGLGLGLDLTEEAFVQLFQKMRICYRDLAKERSIQAKKNRKTT